MSSNNRFVLGAMLILSSIIGIYIAIQVYKYEIIVKGILGFVVLYLQFSFIKSSRIDSSMDNMLEDPKKHKYFIFALIGPCIAFWATGGIFDMISWLVKNWLGS